ncbi:hypothetical protein GIB67_014584 [Kingdonia uniflora]|uniref:Tf2-1-like SH3-like domain-containing protein n=1 Tax=Kingdonia uniflora TaxID=39325 RepID=A0A7J7MNT2_9MAGN|nr:hypothetical protein GIB67_014584 [Kingdonia uniflora]
MTARETVATAGGRERSPLESDMCITVVGKKDTIVSENSKTPFGACNDIERGVTLDPLHHQRVKRETTRGALALCGTLTKGDDGNPGINEYWKKYVFFCTRVEAQGKGLDTIIDGGLTDNLISESVADILRLNLVPHPKLAPTSDSAAEFTESIRSIHDEVRRHLADVYARVNERADWHWQEVIFSSGDLVMLYIEKGRRTGVASKLLLRKSRPYRIIQRIGDNAYELDIPGARSEVVNVKLLT